MGYKTSETETHIGVELIGPVKQRTEADNPFHPSPSLTTCNSCKAIVQANLENFMGDTKQRERIRALPLFVFP